MSLKITYLTAPWSSPCKTLLPKVRRLAEAEGIPLQVIDVEADPWHVPPDVRGVPTILVEKDGTQIAHLDSAMASIPALREALT